MRGNRNAAVLGMTLACLFVAGLHLAISQQAPPANRDDLVKTYKAGNYKDAYDGLRKLALDPKDDPLKVRDDLNLAIDSLRNLGRSDELDDFREAVIAAHKDNWGSCTLPPNPSTAPRSMATSSPASSTAATNAAA